MCCCKKNEQSAHALGRSRGGFSTKIHGVCDALGNPLRFILTGGQVSDHTQSVNGVDGLKYDALLADKGYDSDRLREHVQQSGAEAIIPPRCNRRKSI